MRKFPPKYLSPEPMTTDSSHIHTSYQLFSKHRNMRLLLWRISCSCGTFYYTYTTELFTTTFIHSIRGNIASRSSECYTFTFTPVKTRSTRVARDWNTTLGLTNRNQSFKKVGANISQRLHNQIHTSRMRKMLSIKLVQRIAFGIHPRTKEKPLQ